MLRRSAASTAFKSPSPDPLPALRSHSLENRWRICKERKTRGRGACNNVHQHSRTKTRTPATTHSLGPRRAGTREDAPPRGRCCKGVGHDCRRRGYARGDGGGGEHPKRGAVTPRRRGHPHSRGVHARAGKNRHRHKGAGRGDISRVHARSGRRTPTRLAGVSPAHRRRRGRVGGLGTRTHTRASPTFAQEPRRTHTCRTGKSDKKDTPTGADDSGHTHIHTPRTGTIHPSYTHYRHHSQRRGATRTHPHSPHTPGGGVEGLSPRPSRLLRDKLTHPAAPPRARCALTGARSPRASDAGSRSRRLHRLSTSAAGRAGGR